MSFWPNVLVMVFIAALQACPLYAGVVKKSGYVGGSGSGINYRVILKPDSKEKPIKLCPGKVGDMLANYQRTFAEASGVQEESCFRVASFEILKTPKGNDPIVGDLKKGDKGFFVVAKNKTYFLEAPPSRLKSLLGESVIIDLVSSISIKGKKDKLFNVIFFAKAP